MTRAECETVLRDIARELSLYVIIALPGNPERLEIASATGPYTMTTGEPAYWTFLSKKPLSAVQQQAAHSLPAEWGWVVCTLPRQEGGVLYQSDFGCKSDYYRSETKTIHENPVSIELYVAVVKLLRKKLPFQIYIGPEGGVLKPCRGVKHSQGVVDWLMGGGSLKAEGQVAEYGMGPREK